MKKKLLIISLLTASTMLIAGNYSRSNNIVTDHDTGLQWQDTPYTTAEKAVYNSRTQEHGRTLKWINAKAYCSNLGNGWRLPSINELLTIVDKSYYNPAMDPIFQSALPLGFWSSTLSTTVAGSAQGIGFKGGNVHNCGMSGPAKFIRCVRTGTALPPPSPTDDGNTPPTAYAGPDKTVQVNQPITISGSGNDSDGVIVSYQWTKKSDGYVLANTESFEFTPTGTTSKTLVLTVTDDMDATASDEMVLTVTEAPDTVAPVITLLGTTQIDVSQGSTYTDAGATASDDVDGDITSDIETINPVNTAVLGQYTVTYNVSDSAGNAATEVTRIVNVIDASIPIITLLGTTPIDVSQGSTYNDAGATASDDVDGDITANILTVNPVDTAVLGQYTVTYNVSDSADNTATEVTRMVNVIADDDTVADTVTNTNTDIGTDTAITSNSSSGGGCTYNPNSKNFDMTFLLMVALGLFYPFRRRFLKSSSL